MSYLREQALSMAALDIFDDSEMTEPGHELYAAYAQAVHGRSLKVAEFVVKRFYADLAPDDVLALVETRAEWYEREFSKLLAVTKAGIVDAASEDELSFDLTALDMRSMVERGALL